MVTQERLKNRFVIDENSGDLVYTKDSRKVKAGMVAGTINGSGYRQICVDGKIYNAHRLIWLYRHGKLPDCDIDHINGNRLDNRECNLRLATRSENLQNTRKARSDNQTGYLGVHFNNSRQCFIAKIQLRGKTKHLGYFSDPKDASAAYLAAKRQMHAFSTI